MQIQDDRYINQSFAKVERAIEISDEIVSLCREYLLSKDEKILLRIGALLGDYANNLRSALNYCSKTLLTEQLKPKIEPSKFKNLARKLDFPWARTKDDFDRLMIVKELKEVSIDIYNAFDRFQSYYRGNEWLENLMILSNRDKHEIINNVISPIASSFAGLKPDGTQIVIPKFLGNKLLLFTDEGPVTANLPFYYPPLGAFAGLDQSWHVFMVPIRERFSLDLITYIRRTPIDVIRVLSLLETWFGTFFNTNESS